jgi:alpha-L-fucosidase 2
MTLIVFAMPGLAASHPGLRYAAPKEAILDLETPAGKGPFLAIAAVHGGGWTAGGRSDAQPFCHAMVSAGFACAAIDYRLAPAVRFPGQIEDLRDATRWLLSNATRFNLERRGVILAGESAGGHLVSYLGASNPAGVPILGVIAFSPPTDLVALCEPGRALGVMAPEVRALTGARNWNADDVERLRQASPFFAVKSGSPPFLIVHGGADLLVPPSQSRVFCGEVRRSGGACELVIIPGARHGLWSEDQFGRWESAWYPGLIKWAAALHI